MELNENKDYFKYKLIMEDSFWSLCSNRTNENILQNYQVEDQCFEYKFIDAGIIIEIYLEKTLCIKKMVSLKILREI